MLNKNKRRAIIGLVTTLIILLYVTRSLSILIPFSVTVLALLLFYYIDISYKFNFPERFYIYIFFVFVSGAIIGYDYPNLGLYYRLEFFDKILHFVNPLLLTAIVFFILNRLDITLKWKSLMAVMIVFGVLGVFEIGEYLSDKIFGTLLQGVYLFDFVERLKLNAIISPLDDTMQDLIFGLLGSTLYVGYNALTFFINNKSRKVLNNPKNRYYDG